MSLYIIDTDIFSLYQQLDRVVLRNILVHPTDRLAITVITVNEQIKGWQTRIGRASTDAKLEEAFENMATCVEFYSGWDILRFSLSAIRRFDQLLLSKLNVGGNDLRIAAIALEAGGIVVTRNFRDFRRVPGLICEDWSV